ncbi:hypothetical protein GWI33_001475 [Rhynchophorus ferrugineus]|uniref:Uncharacterized protein n=1 Tax=Rhynchophorus ferrugineus TaxID=354439 RepID=A0A834MI20_RHYFE|nr:hypothetical protein GWI33_001475 [Rhynchophorus ferrugineus]
MSAPVCRLNLMKIIGFHVADEKPTPLQDNERISARKVNNTHRGRHGERVMVNEARRWCLLWLIQTDIDVFVLVINMTLHSCILSNDERI